MHVRIGTRGSVLAKAQAEQVGQFLQAHDPSITYELVVIHTKGDRILDRPLHQIHDKGLFVKEIEQQLLDGKIDLAVHSWKDIPSVLPEGFALAPVILRENARDALVSRKGDFFSLPSGSVVGTGSFRRILQLKQLRNDLEYKNIRGNILTRLEKLDSGQYDALVLAEAGLKRIGLEKRICQTFSAWQCVPAAGQGALAIELRKDNDRLFDQLAKLCDEKENMCVQFERAFLSRMNGSCSIPIGAYMECREQEYILYTVFGDPDRIVKTKHAGTDPQQLLEQAVRQTEEAYHG